MYYGLGLLLALGGFLAANVLASLVVAAIVGPLVRSCVDSVSATSVNLLLALRLFPCAISTAFAMGVLLPAYLLFEPHNSGEKPGFALALGGVAAVTLFAAGLCRGLASCRATSQLERVCRRTAEPVALTDSRLPIYRIRDPFPLMGLVGTLRPRLYVARQILDVLTPAELAAAVTHEAGHASAFDNLKRLLVRAAPDLLAFLPAARSLERAWVRASEIAADACAASKGKAATLDLCAALLKVARLATADLPAGLAVSPLHSGSDLRLRVRRLLAAAESEPAVKRVPVPAGAWIGLSILVIALLAGASELLHAVYRLMETAMRWLI